MDASTSKDQALVLPPVDNAAKAPIPAFVTRLVSGIGEGMLLIALTCFSYAAAYNYKLGTYFSYGLPKHLVSVDLNDCLRAGGAVFSSLFSIILLANVPFAMLNVIKLKGNWMKVVCFLTFTLYALYAILTSLFAVSWSSFVIGMGIFAGIMLVIFFLVAWMLKSKRKTSASEEVSDVYDIVRRNLGFELFAFVMLLPAMAFYAEKLGGANAEKQRDFFRLAGTKFVLIDSIQAGLICKTLREDETKLLPGFTLLSGDEITKSTFIPITLASWKLEAEPKTKAPSNAATPESKNMSVKTTISESPVEESTSKPAVEQNEGAKSESINSSDQKAPAATAPMNSQRQN
ncbi:MAG: hypothetical protein J0L73_09270 [Verrucomicrobia bacterium]|nr:hypothetical protein [Verrucomicrobiota bacterium]